MKNLLEKTLIITLVLVLTGCAASYKPINPPTLNYNSHDLQDGIQFSYKHDVLQEKGNKKYAKKEDKRGVKLVAIKITNHTDADINVGRDLVFYSSQNQIFPMEPKTVHIEIKQIVPGYLPYLILTALKLIITKPNNYGGTTTDVYPIGYVLGPGITFGNMLIAGTANKSMLNELYNYNILSQDIPKGETVYGIIAIKDSGYIPLSVKLKK
jgi:hypothetical protein